MTSDLPPFGLTAREAEVYELARQGLSNRDIGAVLGISVNTVATHMVQARRKIADVGARRGEAPNAASRRGARRDRLQDAPDDGRRDALLDLALHEEAFGLLVDAHFSLYEERVKIIVDIGSQDNLDRIVEHHWTIPRLLVPYRVTGPLVSRDDPPPVDLLDLSWDVPTRRADISVAPIPRRDGTPRVLWVFRPGITEETEWVVRYASPALWRPLRTEGIDSMSWSTGTRDSSYRRPAVRDLECEFHFPADHAGQVVERSGRGFVEETTSGEGRTVVSWRIHGSESARYHWTLTMQER